jgi:hypothetical protein
VAGSKFAGIFDNAAPAERPEPVQEPDAPPSARTRPQRRKASVGRPPGKSSNPDWQLTSVLLRKENKKAAATILLNRDGSLDLSELLDQLLEQWVRRQQKS